MGFPGGSDGTESACNAGGPGFDPWVGKIPWRREWLPTPVFWPGEFHEQSTASQRVGHDWVNFTLTLSIILTKRGQACDMPQVSTGKFALETPDLKSFEPYLQG